MKLFSWAVAAFYLYATSVAARLIVAEVAPSGEAHRWLGSAIRADYEKPPREEDPPAQEARLHRALRANPRGTAARIELGLLEESEAKMASAEGSLLEAVRLDHQHLPAWTLANFYFRSQKQEQFWGWAHEAVRLNFDDLRPIVRLAYAWDKDPKSVLERLGIAVAYPLLDVLVEQDRMDHAQQLARILMARPHPKREAILALTTRQIAHENASWALELWDWLGPPTDLLAEKPDGEAFRPSIPTAPGVQTEWNPGRIAFRLDGTESDTLPLLEQPVAVPVSRVRYSVRYDFSGPAQGISFSLGSATAPIAGRLVRLSLPADPAAREGLRIVRFRLYYHRMPGVPALQGELILRHLQLIREGP